PLIPGGFAHKPLSLCKPSVLLQQPHPAQDRAFRELSPRHDTRPRFVRCLDMPPRQLAPSQQITKPPVYVGLPHQQCLEIPATRRTPAPSHLIVDLEHSVLITTITPPNPATDYQTSTHQQANSQRSPPRWFVPSARLVRRGSWCHHRLNNLHLSRHVEI